MKIHFSHHFLHIFFIVFLLSCQNQEGKPIETPSSKKRIAFTQENKNLEVFEKYAQKIDGNKKLSKIQSLFYTDSDGNTTEAYAWIDEKMEVVKLLQNETKVSGKKMERIFYFLNGLKTMSRQIVYHYELKKPYFSEQRSYYSTKGAVIATFQRYDKQEDLSLVALSLGEKQDCSHRVALDLIKRTGEFETRFRGFDEAFGRNFLVLGTENQSTTLAFNVESPLLKQLKSSENSYKNKCFLDVVFSPITEPNGFTFQALWDLSFAKNEKS
jgi:hypothetical protein